MEKETQAGRLNIYQRDHDKGTRWERVFSKGREGLGSGSTYRTTSHKWSTYIYMITGGTYRVLINMKVGLILWLKNAERTNNVRYHQGKNI